MQSGRGIETWLETRLRGERGGEGEEWSDEVVEGEGEDSDGDKSQSSIIRVGVQASNILKTSQDIDSLDNSTRSTRQPATWTTPWAAPLPATSTAPSTAPSATTPLQFMLSAIRLTWSDLRRDLFDLPDAVRDPKWGTRSGRWSLYISHKEDLAKVSDLLKATLSHEELRTIHLRQLPEEPRFWDSSEQGLLYLPYPFIVPGGRFQEQYAWDSYFCLRGLLRDDKVALARQVTDNQLYMVEHYGTVLNGNRTYYLTRSQLPFLSQMVRLVFERTNDVEWLRSTLPALRDYHRYWTTGGHYTAKTGLSRFHDSGHSFAPEVPRHEIDEDGKTAYDRTREYFKANARHGFPDYDLGRFYDAEADKLTQEFYDGDRAMRESGFDASRRFGPFNADILSYNPVCLNSLLVVMERDMAHICLFLASKTAEIVTRLYCKDVQALQEEADDWNRQARQRLERLNRHCWDERHGLYLDYNHRSGERRHYPFATTFIPLWAGITTPEQSLALARNLKLFEGPGGLNSSPEQTGFQWDAPYAWAPLQLFAVEGLQRAFERARDDPAVAVAASGDLEKHLLQPSYRVASNFLKSVYQTWRRTGNFYEKYNTRHGNEDVSQIRFGYPTNEIGFGWTNGVFTVMWDRLPERYRALVEAV